MWEDLSKMEKELAGGKGEKGGGGGVARQYDSLR